MGSNSGYAGNRGVKIDEVRQDKVGTVFCRCVKGLLLYSQSAKNNSEAAMVKA